MLVKYSCPVVAATPIAVTSLICAASASVDPLLLTVVPNDKTTDVNVVTDYSLIQHPPPPARREFTVAAALFLLSPK